MENVILADFEKLSLQNTLDQQVINTNNKLDMLNNIDIVEDLSLNKVTLITSLTELNLFQKTAANQTVLAFDAEGINLSRLGPLTVASVGILVGNGVQVFLFDMLITDDELKTAQIRSLKQLFENSDIVKIVHDCRQDSDALSAQLGINIVNVFDTAVYGMKAMNSERRMNLNMSLKQYSCVVNENRDEIVDLYKNNPNFWSTRPLTPFMIQYASKDVASLFDLRVKLLEKLQETCTEDEIECIQKLSEDCASEYRSQTLHELVFVPAGRVGCIIGKGGAGIAHIERKSKALLTCTIENNEGCHFLVLGNTQERIDKAKGLMKKQYERFL